MAENLIVELETAAQILLVRSKLVSLLLGFNDAKPFWLKPKWICHLKYLFLVFKGPT